MDKMEDWVNNPGELKDESPSELLGRISNGLRAFQRLATNVNLSIQASANETRGFGQLSIAW